MQNPVIRVGSQDVPVVSVLKGRKGRVRISLSAQGMIVHTGSGKLEEAHDFISQKQNWILKTFHRLRTHGSQAQNYRAGLLDRTLLFGRELEVQYLENPTRKVQIQPEALLIYAPAREMADRQALLTRALRTIAEKYLASRTEHWLEVTKLKINHLRIKDVKSRWGSCSTQRNVNLNWHLVLVDKALSDYVIVHELMHLHEMNHSPRFWKLVGDYLPNYAQLRKQLMEYQWIIGVYQKPDAPQD